MCRVQFVIILIYIRKVSERSFVRRISDEAAKKLLILAFARKQQRLIRSQPLFGSLRKHRASRVPINAIGFRNEIDAV